ncbi:MAG: tubulin/FtsZ family protein [Chloroflexota bacterium]|nr:tubulin/FtsZ family protein [Chloroflexota bacterium]
MRLVVLGLGQCGGRIADEFARMAARARSNRRIDIVTGIYAVNTDQADLTGLRTIRGDFHHRILIGGRKTSGHGVGKINEVGAAVARADSYKVIDAVRTGERFYETDAFLVVAGVAGGTGSGAAPVVCQSLKERYPQKAVYALAILPFEHEESTEERTIYNVATSLKSTKAVADAVILCDNERFLKRDANLVNNMERINQEIVAPFYDLLCAGEEVKRSRIGAKTVDAGDIMQTMEGWTAIGVGRSHLPTLSRLPFERRKNFRKKGRETQRGLEAVDQAISELSVTCSPRDAGKALYMLSAPSKEMNVALVRELGGIMREMAEDAVIRSGDYPRAGGDVSVTLIFSKLSSVPRLKEFYRKTSSSTSTLKQRQLEAEERLREMDEAAEGVPSLLSGDGAR